jgi:hypothetical protein
MRLLKARLTAMIAAAAILTWVAGHTPGVVAFATPLAQRVAGAVPQSFRFPALVPQAAVPNPAAASGFEARVVEDSSGNPLASAEVRFHKIGMRELAADLDTDSEGRLRASGLPPGDYTIDISETHVTASLKVQVPSAGVFAWSATPSSRPATDQQAHPLPAGFRHPTAAHWRIAHHHPHEIRGRRRVHLGARKGVG